MSKVFFGDRRKRWRKGGIGVSCLNQDLQNFRISGIKEINDLTDYHVEVERKRLSRKVSELKFRITQVKQLPVQESMFPDIENLRAVALELVQAEIDRKMALKIAVAEWDFVNPEKLPVPGSYADFLSYIAEKIEMSVDAMTVKNRSGYIVEAIRENYEDPELQKVRAQRAEKANEKELEDLTAEVSTLGLWIGRWLVDCFKCDGFSSVVFQTSENHYL